MLIKLSAKRLHTINIITHIITVLSIAIVKYLLLPYSSNSPLQFKDNI